MRGLAIAAALIVLAAPFAGCGSDKKVEEARSSCRVLALAIASIEPSSGVPAMKVCDDLTAQNADQTLSDMQQNCVRMASSQARSVDKDIPNEKTVSSRNSALSKCNAAIALVRGS